MPEFFIYRDEQKSVKYIPASRINACAQPERVRRRRGRWRPVRYFSRISTGVGAAGALVNPPARRIRRGFFRRISADESVRERLTNRCRHSQDAYKSRWGQEAAFRAGGTSGRCAKRTRFSTGRSQSGSKAKPFEAISLQATLPNAVVLKDNFWDKGHRTASTRRDTENGRV